MTTQTPFYDLTLYNNTTDNVALYAAYRAAQAGVSNSNMQKIDTALAGLQGQITLSPMGISYISSVSTGTNAYTSTSVTTITTYTEGLGIVLNVDVANTGASTLDINSLGFKNLYKVSNGTISPLAANDLVPNALYYFVYNGTDWILIALPPNDVSAYSFLGNDTASSAPSKNLTPLESMVLLAREFGTWDTTNSRFVLFGEIPLYTSIDAATFPNSINVIQKTGTGTSLNQWSWGAASAIRGFRAQGTFGSPTVVTNAKDLYSVQGYGYDGAEYINGGQLKFTTTENWSVGNNGSKATIYTTPPTTATPAIAVTIDNTGLDLPSGNIYKINGSQHPHIIHEQLVFHFYGNPTLYAFSERQYMSYVGAGATIEEVVVSAKTAPSTTALQIKVYKGGVGSIFNPPQYIELPTGENFATRADFAHSTLDKDDYVYLEIVDDDVTVSDVVVHVRYKWSTTDI
ncbi:MAG: hypothetical protein PHU53_06325 [Thermoplasmata archaeon]|nr:hypothetical protein [Thermoplasmata archaeon]